MLGVDGVVARVEDEFGIDADEGLHVEGIVRDAGLRLVDETDGGLVDVGVLEEGSQDERQFSA